MGSCSDAMNQSPECRKRRDDETSYVIVGGRFEAVVKNEILMLLRSSKKYAREISLFEPIGVDKDGEAVSLVDVIEVENREVLEDLILDQDIEELYQAFHACLKEQEQTVISQRYGLFGKQPKTQREIAAVLGISRSYVSRLEKKAVRKMREWLEAQGG